MFAIRLTIVTGLAVLWSSEANVPPAGICNKNPTPVHVDFNALINNYKYWQLTHVSDDEEFQNMTSEFGEITATYPNKLEAIGKINTPYNSVLYHFNLTYGSDFLIYEDAINDFGTVLHFRWTPLAVTDAGALLYYRCSYTGSVDVDTRHISIPTGNRFNSTDEQQLLDADKSFQFVGGIRKLQNAVV